MFTNKLIVSRVYYKCCARPCGCGTKDLGKLGLKVNEQWQKH